MKIIYDDKTTALFNQLTEVIEQETTWLKDYWQKKGAGAMRVQTELSCNPRLTMLRNELARLHSIAMPVRYEFELEKE